MTGGRTQIRQPSPLRRRISSITPSGRPCRCGDPTICFHRTRTPSSLRVDYNLHPPTPPPYVSRTLHSTQIIPLSMSYGSERVTSEKKKRHTRTHARTHARTQTHTSIFFKQKSQSQLDLDININTHLDFNLDHDLDLHARGLGFEVFPRRFEHPSPPPPSRCTSR